MKATLLTSLILITNLLGAQTNNDDLNKFITLFRAQMAKLEIGKVEEHYDQGYFKPLSESSYFDKDAQIGITNIYKKCSGKDEAVSKQEINNFFEQHKNLKTQRKEFASKMNDFNFMGSHLKIRVYPDELRPQYDNHGIVKNSYKGLIEVIVFDLPAGVGSLGRKYLDIWKKSENEIYLLAKENTLKDLNYKFEKAQVAKNGEEFYLLSSDNDLFVTSSILDLKKTAPPVGKYGTLISIPNSILIAALPLNDPSKIDQFALSFMGLTDYMHDSKQAKPVSKDLFWLNGSEMLLIEKDLVNKKLIYPAGLQKLVGK